jgi:hypothetical protein
MIQLDDVVLLLKEWIRFFSLSRFCPIADPYFLPFSIYDIPLQELNSNNLRNVSSTHIINNLPLLINGLWHIAWLYCLIFCCIVSLRTKFFVRSESAQRLAQGLEQGLAQGLT